jgi:hypothetical protein
VYWRRVIMDKAATKAFAEISAINAEITGMLALNVKRTQNGYALAYGEEAFLQKADELRQIAERCRKEADDNES